MNLKQCSLSVFIFILASCAQEPNQVIPTKPDNFQNGFFIPCEGTYGFGNASVAYFDRDNDSLYNDIYKSANNKSLGDQLQSMSFFGDYAYIVVQNSQKIEVVHNVNFESVATIKSNALLSSPRYFIGINANKGYVSDWNADALAIIDLKTNQVTGSIAVGVDPDQMVLVGDKLFVANSGYATTTDIDNRISVIDTAGDTLLQNITVGDRPMSMVLDKEGKLWVACKGFKKYDNKGDFSPESTAGSLYRINPLTFSVEAFFTFSEYKDEPDNLAIHPSTGELFYTNKGKLWKQSVASNLPDNVLVMNRDFYGFNFDAKDNNRLIGCVSTNFTSPGKMVRYDLVQNMAPVAVDSMTVGIGPNAVVFR